MPWLREAYPWLYPRYVELYGKRAYAPRSYLDEISERFARLRLRHGLRVRRAPPEPASRRKRAASSRWPV